MYYLCRKFLGMTYHEFVYEHDLNLVYALLEEHLKFHQVEQPKESAVKKVNPREFFI